MLEKRLPDLRTPEKVNKMFNDAFSNIWNEFNETFKERLSDENFSLTKNKYPKINIYENDKHFVVEAGVPGLNENELTVEIDSNNNILTIKGEKVKEKDKENKNEHMRELKYSSFLRQIKLPNNIKTEPTAEIKNGILTLTWETEKQIEEKNIKKIEVKSS